MNKTDEIVDMEVEPSAKTPFESLIEIGLYQKYREEINNRFQNSPFDFMNRLLPNNKGKFGELYLEYICKKCNIEYYYEGTKNKNKQNGTFDMIINGKRIEVKTAFIGRSGTFQHENLRNEGCDFFAFLNICPEYIYLTILEKFNLNEKHPLLKITPHSRKKTFDVFKFCYEEKHLKVAVEAGTSIIIDKNTSFEILDFFIRKTISKT